MGAFWRIRKVVPRILHQGADILRKDLRKRRRKKCSKCKKVKPILNFINPGIDMMDDIHIAKIAAEIRAGSILKCVPIGDGRQQL